jgi:hypothetical protein
MPDIIYDFDRINSGRFKISEQEIIITGLTML